eukprot:Seg1123.15 transcript_id=Seg1123.15/GoldUCD/mRNA.D3Y31 product="Microtubule-associated protein 9" protein_id=Seg1123.15/GoldUCD/D3Y31
MSLGTSAVNNQLKTKGQNSKWSPSVAVSSRDKVENDIDSEDSDDEDEIVIGQSYKASQPKEVQQRKESRTSAGSVYEKDKHTEGLNSDRIAKSKRSGGKENHRDNSNKSVDSNKVAPEKRPDLTKSSSVNSKSTGRIPVEGHSLLSTIGKDGSMERRRLERKGKFEIAEDSDDNDDSAFDGLTSDLEGHFGVDQSTKGFGPSPRTRHEIDDIFGHDASRGTSSSKHRDVDKEERPQLRPSARNQKSLEQNDTHEFDRKHDDLRQKPRSGSGRQKFDDSEFVDNHRTGIADNKAKFDRTESGRPPSRGLEKERPGLRHDTKNSRSRPGSGAVSPVDFSISSKSHRSDAEREQDRKTSRDDFQRPRSRSGSARDSPVDFSVSSKRFDAEREHDRKMSKDDFDKPRSRSGSGRESPTGKSRTAKGIDKERTKSNPSSGRNSPAEGLLSKDKRSNSRSNEKLADEFDKNAGRGKSKKDYSTYGTKSERSLSPNERGREFEENRRRKSVSKNERVDSRGRSIDGRIAQDDEGEITMRYRKSENESLSKSPTSLRSKSPTVSRSKSPTESRSKSPIEFTAKRPTLSRSKSPAESRSKSPIESRSKGVTESRSKSSSEPRSKSPIGSRSKNPADSRSKSPADSRSKSPADSRSKSPANSRSKSPIVSRSKSPSAQRSKSPTEETKKSPGHSRSRSFGNSQKQYEDTQEYGDKRRPRSRSDARTLEKEDEKGGSRNERDFNMSHSLRKSSLGSMLRSKDSKYGLDSDESDDDDDDDIIGMKRQKGGSRMQNGKEQIADSKARTPNIKKALAPGTNDSEKSQGKDVRVRDEERERDFRPRSKQMGQKFRDAESAESEEESTNRFKIKGHRDQSKSKTTPVKANVVVKGVKSAQANSRKDAKESPREFKNKTMTKRSLSLTNISNLKPKSPYVKDGNDEKRKKLIVDSASLREQIYYDWLKQKTSKTKEELMELKRREKEKQEEEEREKQDKKIVSQKAFEAWQASKGDTITEKQMKAKEQKLKEKEKADEMQQKKLDSKKFFQSWKSQKDEELIETRQKKKEESREKRRKEIEDEEDKRSSSKKVYESWKSRKDELLRAKKNEKKEQEREKRLLEIEKMEKKRKAEKTFESWKENKEKTPRGEMTTPLTQRAWCPGSRNTGNAIPQHVTPVIQRNRSKNRGKNNECNSRLQKNGSLRIDFVQATK